MNVIDTPGYADFVGDVAAALPRRRPRRVRRVRRRGRRGADRGGVANGRAGRAPPRRVREQARPRTRRRSSGRSTSSRRSSVPASRRSSSRSARKPHFRGVVDLLTDTAMTYDGSDREGRRGPVPDEMEGEEHSVHDALVEGIVVADDDLMERYLADETIEVKELEHGPGQGHRRGDACSRCCAAAGPSSSASTGSRASSSTRDRHRRRPTATGPHRWRSCSRRSSTPTSGA